MTLEEMEELQNTPKFLCWYNGHRMLLIQWIACLESFGLNSLAAVCFSKDFICWWFNSKLAKANCIHISQLMFVACKFCFILDSRHIFLS
jgi:hypothetical protein